MIDDPIEFSLWDETLQDTLCLFPLFNVPCWTWSGPHLPIHSILPPFCHNSRSSSFHQISNDQRPIWRMRIKMQFDSWNRLIQLFGRVNCVKTASICPKGKYSYIPLKRTLEKWNVILFTYIGDNRNQLIIGKICKGGFTLGTLSNYSSCNIFIIFPMRKPL